MNYKLLKKIMNMNFPDANTKLVMVSLASFTEDGKRECSPTNKQLTAISCMAKSTVAVKSNWLENNGFISRLRREDASGGCISTKYHIHVIVDNSISIPKRF